MSERSKEPRVTGGSENRGVPAFAAFRVGGLYNYELRITRPHGLK